jgi:hypothetical protein
MASADDTSHTAMMAKLAPQEGKLFINCATALSFLAPRNCQQLYIRYNQISTLDTIASNDSSL